MEIKSGVGKLLLGCRRDTGGIAILYSQTSLHAATYYSKYGNPNDSQYDFIRILEDLNYQYRFISYEQLEQGILKRENYRCLILPCSIALSDKERQQIYSFANSGGKIIADTKPGIYDEHAKPIKKMKWEKLLKNEFIMIGGAIKDYRKDNPDASGMRAFLGSKLEQIGIRPEFTVMPGKGEAYEGELAVFTQFKGQPLTGDENEKIRYIGLLRDHSPKIKKQEARIRLPYKSHIYNMRNGKYSGYTDNINIDLGPGRAGLWAMLPYKVSSLKLDIDKKNDVGGVVNFTATINIESKQSPERHVIRVEAFDPEGIRQRHYCRNLTTYKGRAKGTIPLALNDKKGDWEIKAYEVVSGVSDIKKIRVRQKTKH